jgi:hypothetical protein
MRYNSAAVWRVTQAGLLAAVVTLATGIPRASALVIEPFFDASITGSSNAAAIEASIDAAITTIDGLYSNILNVQVDFTYLPASAGNLLSTSTSYDSFSYSSYVAALQADSTAHAGNSVLATALSHLPATITGAPWGTNGSSGVLMTAALAAMLGLAGGPPSSVININSNQAFGFSQPVSGSQFDLTGGLEHELDEVLGGGGGGSVLNSVESTCPGDPSDPSCTDIGPLDLYRYSSAGVNSFTTSGSASSYFSVNGGTTSIVAFNQDSNGDYGDFAPDCGTGGGTGQLIQNAFNCSGPDEAYTMNSPEFRMLESIGWDSAVPEPFAMACLLPGALALFGLRRHARKVKAD